MKKSLLLTLSLLLPLASNAATLFWDNTDNLATSSGTLLSGANVQFGYFAPGTDFSAAPSAIYSQFFLLASTTSDASGTLTYSAASGNRTAINGTTVLPYDLSVDATNTNGDIAGGDLFALVYTGAAFDTSTEIGIFSSSSVFTWADSQALIQDTFWSFGLDSGNGFVAHIGTASADPFSSPHQLAAIPEPSRALLGLIGLTGVMFRRRRAVKA